MEATTSTTTPTRLPITEEPEQKTSTITKIALAILVVDVALFSFASTGLVVTAVVLEACALGLIGLFKLIHHLADLLERSERQLENYRRDAELEIERRRQEEAGENDARRAEGRRKIEEELNQMRAASSARAIELYRDAYQERINAITRLIERFRDSSEDRKRRIASSINNLISLLESTHNTNKTLYEQTYGATEAFDELASWLENQIDDCRKSLSSYI